MARGSEIKKERLKKIQELRKKGIEIYPYCFDKKDSAQSLQEKFKKIKPDSITSSKAKTAGRVMIIRGFGGITFGSIQDSTGIIQIILQDKKTPEKILDFFKKYIDTGDFVGVEGTVMRTKRGELSILVKDIKILSKALLPLPEKWHGLKDKEERYRKRYLDLIMSPEVKQVFLKRSKTIEALRNFLIKNNFIEVDTPVLQPIAGGAIAKPFITKYNAYNVNVYMRIAPELYLKRLLVGGFEKVFEFSRCFRNEGVDWSHNPEFTNLEFYQAYIDYKELMKITEDLIVDVVKKVNGKAEIERNGKKITIKKPFKKITFKEITKGKMTDEAFKEGIEKIKEPTFIINHPIDISPLAKKNDDKTVQRFQLVIDGMEIVNAFSELNDPQDQEQRFKEQAKKKGEKHEFDKDFVEALEYGMPPAAGFGLGVDRFVMLLAGKDSLRDVLLFPFMREK